jgi:hypothetical protein
MRVILCINFFTTQVKFAEQQVTLKRVKRSHILHDKQLEFPIEDIKDNSQYYRIRDKFDTRDGNSLMFNDQYFSDQWYLVSKSFHYDLSKTFK